MTQICAPEFVNYIKYVPKPNTEDPYLLQALLPKLVILFLSLQQIRRLKGTREGDYMRDREEIKIDDFMQTDLFTETTPSRK